MKPWSGYKFKDGSASEGLTAGQFVHFIDKKQDMSMSEKMAFASQNMTGPALEFTQNYSKDLSWKEFRLKLLDYYKLDLNVRQKVELRKGHKQGLEESVQDFLNRCKKCQFLICDDDLEAATQERDILINFLYGLNEDYYENLIIIDNLSSLEAFFVEALKLEAMMLVKAEVIGEELEDDLDFESNFPKLDAVKAEQVLIKPDLEDDLEDHDDYNDDLEDWEDDLDLEEEPKPAKRAKRSSTVKKAKKEQQSDDDLDLDQDDNDSDYNPEKDEEKPVEMPCQYCGKVFVRKWKFMAHLKEEHGEGPGGAPVDDPEDSNASTKKNTFKVKCGFCDLTFKTRRCLTCVSSAMELSYSNF